MSRRLRVLYSFAHRLGQPGTGRTAWNMVDQLVAHGHDVTIAAGSVSIPVRGATSVREIRRVAGIPLHPRIIGRSRLYTFHDRRVASLLEREHDRYDLVVGWPMACLATFRVAERYGIKKLRHVPNTHAAFHYDQIAKESQLTGVHLPAHHAHRLNQQKLQRQLDEYAAADMILVPSAYVWQTFLDNGVPESKLFRGSYGFNPVDYPRPGADVLQREDEGLKLIYAGAGEPRKGLHYALSAWFDSGASETGELYICGKMNPAYRKYLGDRLEHSSIRRVGFAGDMRSLYTQCDALILPSIEEGSAIVTYEAQACGCTLLVSRAAGAVFEHMKQGLLHEPRDVQELTRQLRRLNEDRSLLRTLRANAVAAYDQLTWDSAGTRNMKLYEAITQG